jgi:hypothetical protein
MPKAGEIAKELRRIASALEREPEAELPQPLMTFYCTDYANVAKSKECFLAAVRLLPRPLNKKLDDSTYEIEHGRGATAAPVWLRATVDRSAVCVVKEPARPAVYECPSLLSLAEEAGLLAGDDAGGEVAIGEAVESDE